MTEQQFSPGFRLSWLDAIVLIVGAAAAGYVGSVAQCFGLAIAFVVAHFFLFCNVLRMTRSLELIWATVFVCLAITTSTFRLVSWPAVFLVSSIATLVVAIAEMRKPSYHGIGWRKLNPGLPEWWESTRCENNQTP